MASSYEIDSFVLKFRNLCHAGLKATLTLEADNGQAFVSLKAGLGCLLPPFPPPPTPVYPSHPRSPSYYRRQERRKATTAAAKQPSVAGETLTNERKENVDIKVLSEEDMYSENVKDTKTEIVNIEKLAEQADKTEKSFDCQVCDFQSQWENGLKLHVARKHRKIAIEQFDEGKDAENLDIDEKYENTKHYWKKGWLGTVYRTFIDANDIIESSDISEEQKKIEFQRVLEARKKAFGRSYTNFPPWCRDKV